VIEAVDDVSSPDTSESDEREGLHASKRARTQSCASSQGTLDSEEDEDWQHGAVFDSLKFVAGESDLDDELEGGDDSAMFAGVDEAEFCARLEELAISAGDNPLDETWLPPKQAKRVAKRKGFIGQPKEYKKGPDVGSKAKRTKQHYRKLLANQTSLTSFGFTSSSASQPGIAPSSFPATLPNFSATSNPLVDDGVTVVSPTPSTAHSPLCEQPESPCGTTTCGCDMDLPVSCNNDTCDPLVGGPDDESPLGADGLTEEAEEAWEDELEEQERGGVEIRGWDELQDQVKDDLAKGAKTLPLSRVSQLMLIQSFATLRLKGLGRVEASLEIARQWHEGEGVHFAWKVRALSRHYQVFEQLPAEKCGGQANALSPLKDEQLQLAAHQWLMSQEVGHVTPQQFCHALNETIIPTLGIALARPLCKQTA